LKLRRIGMSWEEIERIVCENDMNEVEKYIFVRCTGVKRVARRLSSVRKYNTVLFVELRCVKGLQGVYPLCIPKVKDRR
jgi:hypothetical protein